MQIRRVSIALYSIEWRKNLVELPLPISTIRPGRARVVALKISVVPERVLSIRRGSLNCPGGESHGLFHSTDQVVVKIVLRPYSLQHLFVCEVRVGCRYDCAVVERKHRVTAELRSSFA